MNQPKKAYTPVGETGRAIAIIRRHKEQGWKATILVSGRVCGALFDDDRANLIKRVMRPFDGRIELWFKTRTGIQELNLVR